MDRASSISSLTSSQYAELDLVHEDSLPNEAFKDHSYDFEDTLDEKVEDMVQVDEINESALNDDTIDNDEISEEKHQQEEAFESKVSDIGDDDDLKFYENIKKDEENIQNLNNSEFANISTEIKKNEVLNDKIEENIKSINNLSRINTIQSQSSLQNKNSITILAPASSNSEENRNESNNTLTQATISTATSTSTPPETATTTKGDTTPYQKL
ncbi:unnamed protein product [[Candida] boidinii]|nr:unnamed protein product [[Candida] boidinii]